MTLLGMIVCIAILLALGYFVFAVFGEVVFWAHNRLTDTAQRQTVQSHARMADRKISV